jgi:hypothetical protein
MSSTRRCWVKATHNFVPGNSDEDPSIEAACIRAMGEARVDGIIIVPTVRAGESLHRNLPFSIPIVFLDRRPDSIEADAVLCDTEAGVYLLTCHLISVQHRQIAIVGGAESVATWAERVNGYCRAMAESGLPIATSSKPSDLADHSLRSNLERSDRPCFWITDEARSCTRRCRPRISPGRKSRRTERTSRAVPGWTARPRRCSLPGPDTTWRILRKEPEA